MRRTISTGLEFATHFISLRVTLYFNASFLLLLTFLQVDKCKDTYLIAPRALSTPNI